ncbi:MAG TPA: aspartate aminotransferase family protein [Thermoprotei archaeon]|nr:aspartate aminotransferase family protein [Thermoprotei archaeon]
MYEAYLNSFEDYGPKTLDEVRKYLDRTKKSREIFETVSEYIPYGVNSNQRFYPPYPIYMKRARGSSVWDVDDNLYIDFNMGYGALIVGHAHPKINEALHKQLEEGILYTFPYYLLEELTELITDILDIDMFRFSNSGSEAVMFAIRLARAFTGRDIIIKVEGSYHGTYDNVLFSIWPFRGLAGPRKMPVSVLETMGVPDAMEELVRIVPFNDVNPLVDILEEEGDDVAAIIVEPVMMNAGIIKPENGYLKSLRKLAYEYDVVLIFDEVKTALRAGLTTASQIYGVDPDIITVAKAIGGGAVVSLVGGIEEIMSLVGPTESIRIQGVVHAGTYNANPLSLRALYVTLTEILTEDSYRKMLDMNRKLLDGYTHLLREYDIPGYVEEFGVSGSLIFSDKKVKNFRDLMNLPFDLWYPLYYSMLNRGVIPMATGPEEMWTLSVQHTIEDIEKYLEALSDSFNVISEAKRYIEEW